VDAPPTLPDPGDPAAAVRAERDRRLAGLVARAAAGDSTAFERFYEETVPHAQALARRMLPPADLEDVMADAYFQAWREAGRFDAARGGPVTWLLTILRSRALDQLRRRRTEATPEAQDALTVQAAEAPGPQDLLCTLESHCALQAALARLSAQERWLLGLAYYRELSHAQISQTTGLPLGTVKSALQRAQGKLRDTLAAHAPADARTL
jgi:RNA polymerase sigma-70 factor (ECF subfamily)